MPIEATPCGQEVLLEATKLTEELTVLPLPGLAMFTPAKAGSAAKLQTTKQITRMASFFIRALLRLECVLGPGGTFETEGSHPTFRQDTRVVLGRWPVPNEPWEKRTLLSGVIVNLYRINPSVKWKSL